MILHVFCIFAKFVKYHNVVHVDMSKIQISVHHLLLARLRIREATCSQMTAKLYLSQKVSDLLYHCLLWCLGMSFFWLENCMSLRSLKLFKILLIFKFLHIKRQQRTRPSIDYHEYLYQVSGITVFCNKILWKYLYYEYKCNTVNSKCNTVKYQEYVH